MDEARAHSTYYVAQKLGISIEHFVTEADLQRPEIQQFIKDGGKIIIPDDAAYSGANIDKHLRELEGEDRKIQSQQVLVLLVGITTAASKKLDSWDGVLPEISAEIRIPEVKEVLQNKDGVNDYQILRFMKRLGRNDRLEQLMVDGSQVLSLFWQKVPDNFLRVLRQVDNEWWDGSQYRSWDGYLVKDLPGDPRSIHPDYRNGRTFSHS